MRSTLSVWIVVGILTALPAKAAIIAYDPAAGTVGNQNFGGALGIDFNVISGIEITELGVFDSASDGLANSLTATLYNRATQTALATLTFTPGDPGTLTNGSRFKRSARPLNYCQDSRARLSLTGTVLPK